MMLRDRETLFRWKLFDFKTGKVISQHTKRKFALQKKPEYCLKKKRNPSLVQAVYIPPGCNVLPPQWVMRVPQLENIK